MSMHDATVTPQKDIRGVGAGGVGVGAGGVGVGVGASGVGAHRPRGAQC